MQVLFNCDSLAFFKKITSSFIVLTFLTSLIVAPAGAQVLPILNSPVSLTTGFASPVLLGLKIHPENPLLFDFIVDQGQSKLSTDELKSETTKLVKYFLAALTIPDKEVWVNLSPTEKDRIIPDVLGQTTMGKTMLEQDYVLKQLAASLTNPETELGKKYWAKVNEGSIPVRNGRDRSLQNKVWIMPAKAEVLESNGIVLVGEKRLKVMMAEEYDAQMSSLRKQGSTFDNQEKLDSRFRGNDNISSQIFRTTILPTIEKAVNEGKDFADVRQIYNSVILAAWYKKALKESLLGKIYTDKGKVAGVETDDKDMKQRIYEQYLAAFKKGAYNLIKEEANENGDLIPRKYFSGGIQIVAGSNVTGWKEFNLKITPVDDDRIARVLQEGGPISSPKKLNVVQILAEPEGSALRALVGAQAQAAPSSGVAITLPEPEILSGKRFEEKVLDGTIGVGRKLVFTYWADVNTQSISTETRIESIDKENKKIKFEEYAPIALDKIISVTLAASSAVDRLNQSIVEKGLVRVEGSNNIKSGVIDEQYQYRARLYKNAAADSFTVFELLINDSQLKDFVIWEGNFVSDSPAKLYEKYKQDELALASSALDAQRAAMVGQPLTEQQAIIDAFNLNDNGEALVREGDEVEIKYIYYRYGTGEENTVVGKITEINRQTIGQPKPITRYDTVVRVGGFGTKLANISSITLKTPAASSTVDVKDVDMERRMYWVELFRNTLESMNPSRKVDGMDSLSRNDVEVKTARIGSFSWAGIYFKLYKNWYEIIVDEKNQPVAYGVSRILSVGGEDFVEITFNVLKDAQNKRIARGKDEINSKEVLDGRLQVLRSITGKNRFFIDVEQINGQEAIERGAVIFYLKYGFDFLDTPSDLVQKIINRVRQPDPNNQKLILDEIQLKALAFSGRMVYTLPSQSEARTTQFQLVQQQQAQDNRQKNDVGGIDFDPTNMNLQIKRDGKGVPLPLPQQNLEQINIQGLFPVIINITPINAQTLPIFLGQASKEPAREPELAASTAG